MVFPVRVSDVMSRTVYTIDIKENANKAAKKCLDKDRNPLVVIENEKPVGIVTATDFIKLASKKISSDQYSIEKLMSSPLIKIESEKSIVNAVEKMYENDMSQLVVFEDGEVVGIISKSDIIHYTPQIFHRQGLKDVKKDQYRYHVRQETAYENKDWEFECFCVSDNKVSIGDKVRFTKTITEQDVRTFALASGDTNRLHIDEEYAKQTRFGRRIVHGTLVSGLISAALARLPGLTIYLSQDLTFLSPVNIEDRVTAVCEVREKIGDKKYELITDVLDKNKEKIIEGEAVVLMDPSPKTAKIDVEKIQNIK